MAHAPASRPYRWLAKYYDALFSPIRAPIDTARRHIVNPVLPGMESACDLACGTGTTAVDLASHGIKTFAVDASPTMCRLAREKARRTRVPLRVLRADMRTFRLPQPVDLITCEFDSLNHVPQRTDLRMVARAAARALRPGGYFYFDVNNRLGFEQYWTSTFWIEQPGVIVAMHNGNDSRHDRAWSDVDWFIREGHLWRRHQERVDEVCWSDDEIRSALRKAGFKQVRKWDATLFFKNNLLMRRGCRTFYLARKPPA